MGHSRYSRAQIARGEGRQWKTVKRDGNVHFIEKLNSKKSASMPMHTHTKTKVYASVENGKLKSISVMNPKTGKKVMDIHHLHDHKGLGSHIHRWKDGKRIADGPATRAQLNYLAKLKNIIENTEK